MIWGSFKVLVFMALACVAGFFLSTTRVGGKPLSDQIGAWWNRPETRKVVGEVTTRVKRGVDAASSHEGATPGGAPQTPAAGKTPTRAEPPSDTDAAAATAHAAIRPSDPVEVLAEPKPADAYRPAEREAVARLIAQRARHPSKPH